VSLHQFGFEDCFMGITRELTDVAFSMGTLDEHHEVACKSLHEEPMVVAMAADHPLAARSRLHISEVIGQPLFTDVHPPGKWRDFWDATAYRGGKPPQIISRATTHDEWLEALRLSSGISLCPQSTPRYYPRPGLAFVPLDGVAPIIHWVIWRKETPNRHVDAFVRTVSAVVARELRLSRRRRR
jgi:DNA-binding transcriptional LysR family regulator